MEKRKDGFTVVKSTKSNEWFRSVFLESFGLCRDKKLSEKQGKIFERYLKPSCRYGASQTFSEVIDGKIVKLSKVFNRMGTYYYVTIQADNFEEEERLKKEFDQLNEKFDIMIESGATDEELDNIEKEIDNVLDALQVLRF